MSLIRRRRAPQEVWRLILDSGAEEKQLDK